MKISKTAISLFVAIATANSYASSFASSSSAVDFSRWSKNDLEQFLSDFNIEFDPKEDHSKLAQDAQAHWNSFTKPYQSWSLDELEAYLKYKQVEYKIDSNAADTRGNLIDLVGQFYPNMDEFSFESVRKAGDNAVASASASASSGYDKVSNWIFDTWTNSQLAEFVKRAKDKSIKSVAITRKELQKQAKEIYDRNVESSSNYGQYYYPGKWIFDNWSDDSLRSWLEKNRVNLEQKGKNAKQQALNALDHNALVSTVCKNSRNVHANLQDARSYFLSKVGIANDDIYNKAGQTKYSILEKWSDSQLAEWLGLHKLYDSSSKQVLNKEELIKLVQDNTDLLKDDINKYLNTATHAVPDLSKPFQKDGTLIDKSFEMWDSSKLDALVERLRKDIPNWLKDHTDDVASEAAAGSESVEYKKNKALYFVSHLFDFWSTSELVNWLETQDQELKTLVSDIKKKASTSAAPKHEQFMKVAYEYFSSAGHFTQEKYDSFVNHLSDGWRTASATAFESWSDADLESWIKTHTPNYKEQSHDAKKTHMELVNTARDLYKDTQKRGNEAVNKVEEGINEAASDSYGVQNMAKAAAHVAKVAVNVVASAGASAHAFAEVMAGDEAYGYASAGSDSNSGEAKAEAHDGSESSKKAANAEAEAESIEKGTKTPTYRDSTSTGIVYWRQSLLDAWGWVSNRVLQFGPSADEAIGHTEL